MIQVRNMRSPRSGREVANQFDIWTDDAHLFQSYDTIIARKKFGYDAKLELDPAWDCSPTTLKYLKEWLETNMTKHDIQVRINAGHYIETDLNGRGY